MGREDVGDLIADSVRAASDAVALALSGGEAGREVLDRIARAAATLLEAKLAVVWVADPRKRVLRVHGRYAADERLGSLMAAFTSIPWGHGVVGQIFESRVAGYVEDIREDRRWLGEPPGRDAGLRGHAGIPLIASASPVGVLSVFFDDRRQLTAEKKDLLDLLAEHAALAIENDRLRVETERRGRAAEGLEAVGRLLLHSLDPQEVGQRIVDSVRVLVRALRATLVQAEPESDALRVLAISGEEAFPLGTGVARFAIRERHPLITPDLLTDPRVTLTPDVRALLERIPVRAVLSVPLFVGDRVIGALSVGDGSGRVFEEDEIQLLQAFADRAAIAIHNAGLYHETRRQQQEAVALEEVAREITSSLERDEVFQRILHRARELCGSDLAFLAPYDAKAGMATIVAASGVARALPALGVRPGQGAGGRVLETGEPFVTDDYLNDSRVSMEQAELPARIGVLALAVVPLRFRGSITGLLWVANRTPRGFTSRDLRVLTKLADQAAIALENSRLYAEAQELAVSRERVRVATQLHDTLSQMLFSVALGLDWCLHRLAGAPELRTKIQEIKRETGLMMRQMRELIGHLAPEHSRDGEYPDQLQRLVRQFRELTGIPVELIEHGDASRLTSRQREVLYKTFQEALANVAKHARATRATIRVDVRPSEVCFEITDDGIGPPAEVDLARLDRHPGHFGLRQMLERIEAVGGAVAFGLVRPSGFRLWGTLPIHR